MKTARLISLKTVIEWCSMSRATVYRQVKAGHFPEPIRVTGGPNARRIAWREDDIQQWLSDRQNVPLKQA
ncbi:helix-turn-helix transcriptional regulator [Serratia fonticola]|uniref:helix-turn-helix transcriptional regulator n=1 Tax=Serratia fonticola TaxID=47917 RepID=UPI0016452E08|nr:AlpA family phage regulatory protein [Serratia fonticola]MBC3229973.1 AlpA family phage regulatory protein [Serratia fonticola]